MLSKYDEFPVHQTAHPFSQIPSTDYSWDEGYYFGVFNADKQVFLLTGLRINPNADMVGGYAVINVAGRQYSVRLSRCWRQQIDTVIGPLSIEFVEPLKVIRLRLEANDSALSFDLTWTGIAPATLEAHHHAQTRGRVTTDQTRYSQPGEASGFIQFEDERYEVEPQSWAGNRDHSWGLYADRKPLGGFDAWLPPKAVPEIRRAMRFWIVFKTGSWSGFYHIHESENGEQVRMNDVFGAPFEGSLCPGWDQTPVKLASASHALRFRPSTRILESATLDLRDEQGRLWVQHVEVASPPWVPQTMGYTPGSWKDGGTLHTYHGSEELAIEWDDFDFSRQPFDYTPYPPEANKGASVSNQEISAAFGLGTASQMQGVEYLVHTRLIDPDGNVHEGQGHLECFINGRFTPYGFE
ncbi:hypothetical protein [Pseudomonas umsongensis]|uniref:hypothetical protein n=1 Tax=Pseudomonas umsongensis TaxID=198618 RepID=UPI00200A3758|nr:hypothetical protein [Pseudomonas umsongensis]MCK8683337.1 hypothetical protein [Pseudomonas umsongensis]